MGENLFYKKGFHQNCKLCKAKRATRKQVLRKQNEPDQQKTDSRRGLLKSAWGGALFLGILRILRILGIYRCAAIILRWFVFGLNTAMVCVPYTCSSANKSVQYTNTPYHLSVPIRTTLYNHTAYHTHRQLQQKKGKLCCEFPFFCFLRFADQRGSNGPGSEVSAIRSISLKP